MGEPTKIRASMQGDVAEIRILVRHTMETGLAKDSAGNAIPAHFVNHLAVSVGDLVVLDSQLGTAVSRNPVFALRVKGAKAGDKVVVTWKDNKGDRRTDEAVIVAGTG